SKSFLTSYSKFMKKFAHKILDHEGNEFLLKDEITIGYSSNGLRQLKALFLHDEKRTLEKLIIQQFDIRNSPIKNAPKEASFHGREVESLYQFLKSIKEVEF